MNRQLASRPCQPLFRRGNAPATISVIDREEINSKPFATVADVLRDVPGAVVSAPSGQSGAETVSIRGLGEGYVLTMVDGRPVGNSQEPTNTGLRAGKGLVLQQGYARCYALP